MVKLFQDNIKENMLRKNLFICLSFSLLLPAIVPAQEALKSAEEEYYDFLVLQGLTERPALNYRTLSDLKWNINETEEHPWQKQNLSIFHPLFGDFRMRVYGPELFTSYNTAAPYGQNDGVLWQGRGFNALFKGGARFEGYGVELTLLPHFAFSQNAPFDIMPSAYESEYGYFWGYGVDAPQRFGNEPFFDWDFGDSEIRYTWKTLTIGFGTQAIWLGPAYLSPILHSNNAPAYPKFDIGLRRQRVTIPWLDWYLGDVEARLWVGQLTESNYFDDNDANDYTMFHGLAFAYAPSFLPGLTLFANRVCLVPWEWDNLQYIIPRDANTIEDQKASFGFLWIFPQVGFEVYGELGIDDFVLGGGRLAYVRHPFHTTVYTGGLKKTLKIAPEKSIYGEIILEYNWMEMTQDYQFRWPYSFYFHHLIIHGYTNKGQYLANGISSGGNNQYLVFVLYYPKGNSLLFIGRNNPDNNFLYKEAIYASAEDGMLNKTYGRKNKANFLIGIGTEYFLSSNFSLSCGMVYDLIINPQYYYDNEKDADGQDIYQTNSYDHNFSFQLGVKLTL
jgi:hypothetical protein